MSLDRTGNIPRLPRGQSGGGQRALERIRDSLEGLRHGEVTVVVQDGVVVQIERTDKLRLPRNEPQP